MNYETTNFNPQQNWMQQPEPPQKSPNAWVKWVVIAVIIIGLIAALIFFVANLGKKFGKTIGDVSKTTITMADSLQAISVNEDYDSVYAIMARDSSSMEMKWFIDDLRNSTDSIIQLFNENQKGFKDTIGDAGGLSQFDKSWGHNYFIKTGRALKLKHILIAYRENEIHFLPTKEQDDYLRNVLQIDEGEKLMPGFLKNLGKWENINFDQAPMTVNLNFTKIKMQIRAFEKEMLDKYKNIITNAQESGLRIVMPNADTAH